MRYLIIFLLCSQSLWAGNQTFLSISPTLSLSAPFRLGNALTLLSMNSRVFEIETEKSTGKARVFILNEKPRVIANKFSVERYWNTNRFQTKRFDSREKDLGCFKHSSTQYFCSRDVEQSGQFLSEKIFWNGKEDLVLIRVTAKSFAESRKILDSFRVKTSKAIKSYRKEDR